MMIPARGFCRVPTNEDDTEVRGWSRCRPQRARCQYAPRRRGCVLRTARCGSRRRINN